MAFNHSKNVDSTATSLEERAALKENVHHKNRTFFASSELSKK